MTKLEHYKERLIAWLSEQNEYQVYLNTILYLKFVVIGFLLGTYFIANTLMLQLGYVPNGLESTVKEVTIACAIVYTVCVALILALESKLA